MPTRRTRLRSRSQIDLPRRQSRRKSAIRWYGTQLRRHPLGTILAGVAILGIAAGPGLFGLQQRYAGRQAEWSDKPAAATGTAPPYAAWENTPYNVYGGSTIRVTEDGGRRAIRFFGPASAYQEDNSGTRTQRAELVPRLRPLTSGREVWIGFDLKLNGDLGRADDFQQVMQLKNNTEGSPSLVLAANTNEAGGLDVRRNTGPAADDTAKQALGPLPVGGYSRIVLGMRLTKSPSSSWVEVWRDGQPRLLRQNWEAYNQAGDKQTGGLLYANASSAYLKFGLYRAPQDWPMEVRLADVRIGPDRASVQ